jgi:hypothetical protein
MRDAVNTSKTSVNFYVAQPPRRQTPSKSFCLTHSFVSALDRKCFLDKKAHCVIGLQSRGLVLPGSVIAAERIYRELNKKTGVTNYWKPATFWAGNVQKILQR